MAELFTGSQLFACGVVMMAAAALLGAVAALVTVLTGRRLKKRLNQEYGKEYR